MDCPYGRAKKAMMKPARADFESFPDLMTAVFRRNTGYVFQEKPTKFIGNFKLKYKNAFLTIEKNMILVYNS